MTDSSPAKPSTRERLLAAAEELFAEKGLSGTSTRAILQRAGQRNESALQYHFGGREGLLEALYVHRGTEIATERELMLAHLLEQLDGAQPTVRQICEVALLPPVRVARRRPETVRFLEIVGQIAFLPNERLREINQRYEFGSVRKVRELLEGHRELAGLPPEMLLHRLALLQRIAAVSLSQRARNSDDFAGPEADLYWNTVLDALAALLTGQPSPETSEALHAVGNDKSRRKPSATGAPEQATRSHR